ncbi:MAG: phosphate acyltransferase PlsX [Verrucomicrobia bacterium]|nr:MAG: phosphate acyltransferase PlsX [Verrucomicrobiota bacterium]
MVLDSRAIAIDVMGADKGPGEVIEGVKHALKQDPGLPLLTLVGIQSEIEPLLKKHAILGHPKLKVIHASDVIGMDEKPTQGIKKKDSSMMRCLDLIKSEECAAMVSCGNTGSLMAGATVRLRLIPGLERPALSTVIPSKDHLFILLDVGANPETTSKQLMHNAILGTNHSQIELGIHKPKIGLLTIGTEEGKGTERIQEAHKYLKSLGTTINYTGLIEGFHVFEKDVDIVVCDGFVGNILIKTCESLFHMLKELFKEELTANPVRKLGAVLSMQAFKAIKHKFNPDRYSAAPLLGVNGIVLKAHGSSNSTGIMNAIFSAQKMLNQNMNKHILLAIAEANEIIKGGAA